MNTAAIETTAVTSGGTPASTAISTAIGVIDFGLLLENLTKEVATALKTAPLELGNKKSYEAAKTQKYRWVRVRTGITGTHKDIKQATQKLIQNHLDIARQTSDELLQIAAQAEGHFSRLVTDYETATEQAERDKSDAAFNLKNDRLVAAGINLPRGYVETLAEVEIDDKISEATELARFKAEQAAKETADKLLADQQAADLAAKNQRDAALLKADREAFDKEQADAAAEAAARQADIDRLNQIEADKISADRAELVELRRQQQERDAEAQRNLDDEKAKQRAEIADTVDAIGDSAPLTESVAGPTDGAFAVSSRADELAAAQRVIAAGELPDGDHVNMPSNNISQIDLVFAITDFVTNSGVTQILSRELNTIIRCATEIVNEFAKPEITVTPAMGLDAWMRCDNTGISSLFMAGVLGGFSRPLGYPHDPSDFGRCLGLLDAVPEFRARIGEMSQHGPQWSALVSAWDELETIYREELPSGVAFRCYERMCELLKGAGDGEEKSDHKTDD